MPLAPGTRFGPYQILAPLGAGGMGEVYRARDTRLARDVALKVLPAEVANDPARRQRFELEGRAVAALNHPNIVAIYDVGVEGGVAYIVSELVEGEPLQPGKLSLRKTLDLGVQIAAGLAAAHEAGITHRDLKPANILLTRDGRPKILDFGLAKVRAAHAAGASQTVTVRTEPGVVMGTVGYMSPEQVRGLEVDPRSDLFSFGVILYELLGGKRPFAGETSVDTMQAILRQDAPELSGAIPAAVRLVVAHCLEKEPASRFQSARDLGFALSAILQSGSAPTPALSAPRRRWPLAAALAIALTLVAAATTFFWLRGAAPPIWTGIMLGGPEYAQLPKLAPDGHTLAFLTSVGAVPQVAVMKPETGNWAVLTHSTDAGYVQLLSWSSDGTRIYFDRWTDVPRGIYSVPALGGAEQLVMEDAGQPEALPDGTLLAGRYNSDRQYQLVRFWPENGRVQTFPLEMSTLYSSPLHALPGGQAVLAVGTRIGPGREEGVQAWVLDLASGSLRKLMKGPLAGALYPTISATRDGKTALLAVNAGNVIRIVAVSRDGRILNPDLLTLTGAVNSMDVAADGSIYLDQLERPAELVRFPVSGGRPEKLATLPGYEGPGGPALDDESFAVLPDGRAVVAEGAGGRMHLLMVEAGKDAVPFLNTAEPADSPVAAAGPRQIAFLIGPPPSRTLALADTSTGRILRRIALDRGNVSSLAATPDGTTLYAAAGGFIWAIPTAGGEPRKIRAGDHVAADPSGRSLLVEVIQSPIIRLIRIPLDGSPEREIPIRGELRPANVLGPNAIGPDGRILMPLGSSTWAWPAGLLDPAAGRFSRIPVDYATDFHVLNWTPDGKVMAMTLEQLSRMWKFQPSAR